MKLLATINVRPVQGRSLRKQEAALEARRRADLADLRSIMAAGAAAHGCTSPAPTLLQVCSCCAVEKCYVQRCLKLAVLQTDLAVSDVRLVILQGLLGEDDTSSEAASPRVLADAVRSGSPSLFGNCGGTPASELVARALATPGYAAPAATAAAGWEPHSNLQRADALPDSAAAGLRRDATGMAALLEVSSQKGKLAQGWLVLLQTTAFQALLNFQRCSCLPIGRWTLIWPLAAAWSQCGCISCLQDLQCRLDGIRSCAALEASSPDACAATAAAADSADGSASLVARLAAAEAALTASAAEAAGLWAALAASKARAADFQVLVS